MAKWLARTIVLGIITLCLASTSAFAEEGGARSVIRSATTTPSVPAHDDTKPTASGSDATATTGAPGGTGRASSRPAPKPTPTPTPPPTSQPADGGGSWKDGWHIYAMIGGMILLFIWMGRKPKKEQAQRRQMLDNLKKGDKVTSIGGIVGTVVEIREEEVMVKVDETSNTRMRFAKWAVRQVGEPRDEQTKDKK